MHLFQNTLLRDVFAACEKDNTCFIRNDGMHSINVRVHLEYWILSQPRPIHSFTHSSTLHGLGGEANAGKYICYSV